LSDLGHDTLISADAPFFTALSGMSVGARIVFDGQFFSSDADCIEEMSLMQANSMHEPEFLFRFSDVRAAP